MAKAPVSKFPAWIKTLRPDDQKYARKWIAEVGGEAAFRRIADALPSRKPQRPTEPPAAGITYATRLYVVTPGMIIGDAAGEARKHFSKTGQLTSSPANFRRRVSEELNGLSDADWHEEAVRALEAETCPRADLFPHLARIFRVQTEFAAIEARATPRFKTPGPTVPAYIPKLLQHAERVQQIVAFMNAFGLPDDLPISVVAKLYDRVRTFLDDELSPDPDQSAAPR